jgi:hypothetical protein
MIVSKEDLARFAAEVRDQARHAAVCAFKGEDPIVNIEQINIESLVDHFWDEDYEEGLTLVAKEREKAINAGYGAEHDDTENEDKQLALVAALYASPERLYTREDFAAGVVYEDPWPWARQFDERPYHGNALKERTEKQDFDLLVKAGALIVAEIDRRLRLKKKEAPSESE